MRRLKDALAELDSLGFRNWEDVPVSVLDELGIAGLAPQSGPICPAPPSQESTAVGHVDPEKLAAVLAKLTGNRPA